MSDNIKMSTVTNVVYRFNEMSNKTAVTFSTETQQILFNVRKL